MRKILRNFVNGTEIELKESKKLKFVYTIIDEHKYADILKDGHLEHLSNVYLEDYYHDWRVDGNIFKFYGHSGSKGQTHDLLLIFE